MKKHVNSGRCTFGCGRQAVKQLKNGKYICAESANSCPVMRDRNAAGKRGRNPFANRPHPRGMTGRAAWNRGLTWEQMFGVARAERMRSIGRANAAHAQAVLKSAPEIEARRRQKLSAYARQRALGGYERGSGRGKKGWYRGHWCDSTYELAFVVWALDHNVAFERNLMAFAYEYQGRAMRWLPDFRLADGTFIEIKGYLNEQARAKFEFFLPSLLVLTHAELAPMFEYVWRTYGRNLVELYE